MTKVFIAGSRQLSRLPAEVKRRVDAIIDKGFTILVGDANGADKAIQRHLSTREYRNVIVHCMTGHCRNNLGGWPQHDVAAPNGAKGFAYYSLKDQVMVDEASHGLMLWDGASKGTLNSIIKLARLQKPDVVYLAPVRTFHTIRTPNDVAALLDQCDRQTVRRLEGELGIDRASLAGPIGQR